MTRAVANQCSRVGQGGSVLHLYLRRRAASPWPAGISGAAHMPCALAASQRAHHATPAVTQALVIRTRFACDAASLAAVGAAAFTRLCKFHPYHAISTKSNAQKQVADKHK